MWLNMFIILVLLPFLWVIVLLNGLLINCYDFSPQSLKEHNLLWGSVKLT